MKKENIFKKFLICTTYLVLAILCILGIFFLIYHSSSRENDSIVRAQDSSTYLRSINPKFLVDFVNDEYIRFETVSSYSNPFEGKEPSIWEKIRYFLGIKQERKGIQISLIDVSYDTDLSNILEERDINISEFSLNRSFELISSGREIGEESDEAISKDTVISRNIYEGVDIEYQIIKGKGLKEEIVLNEIPKYTSDCSTGECTLPVNRFLFELELDEGLEIRKSMDGNTQYPSGVLYIADKEGNYFAHFLPEFAKDALGTKTSNVVSNISRTDSGRYIFEIILDPEWLLSEERVFPIRIDPSIVHDSKALFNEGIYDKVNLDEALMITLADGYSSGAYTSSILDLGSNSKLNGISWDGYSQATGDGELSYSVLGLISQEGFNDLTSLKSKWGSGALQLDTLTDTKTVNINSNESNYFTLELWSNSRYIQNEQYIFKSNLLNLKVKDMKYVLEDINGTEYITQIPVKYNSWEYLALELDLNGSMTTLYVNELSEEISVVYTALTLDNITFTQNMGYIDALRVYDRLVPRNELLANSQYSNIYLQYTSSDDGMTWTDWYTTSKYLPVSVVGEKDISLTSTTENFSNFEILSFRYLTQDQQDITLGSSKFVNGIDEADITRLDQEVGDISLTESVKYLDLVFTPNVNQNACILTLGGLQIYTLDTGKVELLLGEEVISTTDMYIPSSRNIISLSLSDTQSSIYLNGNILENSIAYTLAPTNYSKGQGCTTKGGSLGVFNGEIQDVRVSTNLKSNEEILEYSKVDERTYTLKSKFKAKLQKDGDILDLTNTTFSIAELESSQFISNLYEGDVIAIYQDTYSVQGIVHSLDMNTGLVTVASWEGTVPQLGFSTQASIVKWETEYIFTDTFLNENISTNTLNIKSEMVYNIKDTMFFNTLDSGDEVIFEDLTSRYLKYKFIYITSRLGISSSLASVNIDFESGGPEMDQILRHGQWFNEGSKQNFWWIDN